MMHSKAPNHEARFPTTQWSLILASQGDKAERKAALTALCASYWQPLYCYARRKGQSSFEAEDAIQGFLTSLVESESTIDRLDPTRGKLRNFLKKSLKNYLLNEYSKQCAQKRGGGAPAFSLDFEVAESALSSVPDDPEVAYDRAWASQLVGVCLERLIAEYESGERTGPAAVLRDVFGFGDVPSHAEIAIAHGMTESQVKAFIHRARRRFRTLILGEVANTVSVPTDVGDEVRRLFELLR